MIDGTIDIDDLDYMSFQRRSLSTKAKCLGVHHSNESWNPEKLLILRELLDSIFRWNDETTGKFSILRYFRIKLFYIVFVLFNLLVATTSVQAQMSPYNHPELRWRTIESKHAVVHFHEGGERTARTIAGIADQIYDPITTLYRYEPDAKIHWIIRDHDAVPWVREQLLGLRTARTA